MEKLFILIFVISLWSGCQSEETKFQKCETAFNNSWSQVYDDLPFEPNRIYDVEKLKEETPFLEKTFEALKRIDENELKGFNRQDFLNLKSQVTSRIEFLENKIKKNPSIFSLKKEIEELITVENSTPEEVLKILKRFPRHYEFAKSKLDQPELEQIEEALEEQKEIYFLLKNQVPLWVKKHGTTSLATNHFSKKNKEAMLAIKDWIAFLNSEKFEIKNKGIGGNG